MHITKLQKEVLMDSGSVRLTVEITLLAKELEYLGYGGFDILPDELIPAILVAIGKAHKGKIRNGKLDKVSTLIP